MSQDVEKFFDSIDYGLVVKILKHWRAPPQLVTLISGFYFQRRRLFVAQGVVGDRRRYAQRGLLQGCPFSPLIAGALMRVWVDGVCTSGSGVDGCVYLDDRSSWPLPGAPPDCLLLAQQRSDWVDGVFGLRCRPPKSQIAVASQGAMHFQTDRLGYGEAGSTISLLGITHDLTKCQQPCLVNFEVQLARARLRFIRFVAHSPHQRRVRIRTLINPLFTWAAGFAVVPEKVLNSLRTEVLYTFRGKLSKDTPPRILLNIVGWQFGPVCATDWAILLAGVRYELNPPVWIDAVSLPFSCKPWYEVIPQLRSVLAKHEWFLSDNGKSILRYDDLQCLRAFCFGFDRPRILWDWLVESHQKRVVRSCGRVVRSLHRRGPDHDVLAQGLSLGPPPAQGAYLFNGHRKLFENAGADKDLRTACLASGSSIWFEKAGQKVSANDPSCQCMCGGRLPSRPHLLWCCPATARFI